MPCVGDRVVLRREIVVVRGATFSVGAQMSVDAVWPDGHLNVTDGERCIHRLPPEDCGVDRPEIVFNPQFEQGSPHGRRSGEVARSETKNP